jgi:hypothetical protein
MTEDDKSGNNELKTSLQQQPWIELSREKREKGDIVGWKIRYNQWKEENNQDWRKEGNKEKKLKFRGR